MEIWQQEMEARQARHEERMAQIDRYIEEADERLARSFKVWERSTELLDAKMVQVDQQNQRIAEGMELLGGAVSVMIEHGHTHGEVE